MSDELFKSSAFGPKPKQDGPELPKTPLDGDNVNVWCHTCKTDLRPKNHELHKHLLHKTEMFETLEDWKAFCDKKNGL